MHQSVRSLRQFNNHVQFVLSKRQQPSCTVDISTIPDVLVNGWQKVQYVPVAGTPPEEPKYTVVFASGDTMLWRETSFKKIEKHCLWPAQPVNLWDKIFKAATITWKISYLAMEIRNSKNMLSWNNEFVIYFSFITSSCLIIHCFFECKIIVCWGLGSRQGRKAWEIQGNMDAEGLFWDSICCQDPSLAFESEGQCSWEKH